MISKKILLIIMGMLLSTATFLHATNHRKMQKQHWKTMAKNQRYQDKQRKTDPFKFTPNFKTDTLQGQFILGLLLISSLIGAAEAFDNKLPSTQVPSNCLDVYGEDRCISQSVSTSVFNSRIDSTTSALTNIFCPSPMLEEPCLTVLGSNVIFRGSEQQVSNIINKFEDFDSLRKKVIPTSPKAAKTIAHSGPQFNNWHEVEMSLGVNSETLQNMAYLDDPEERIISINYKPEIGKRSFNQRMADSYLETLMEESEFFKFISNANKGVVTYKNDQMIINYNLFDEYFRRLDRKKISEVNGISSITIPLDITLKRLIAAVSSQVSLEESGVAGEYHVRSVNVASINIPDEENNFPLVEIIVDTSGSMSGDPIHTVNKILPRILRGVQSELKNEEHVNVDIYSLNHQFALSQSFDLNQYSIPKFSDMHSSGGTDLTPIGKRLKIQEDENPKKIVVAFTDGVHASSENKLDEGYYSSLRDLQKLGNFAQPYLCKVGKGSDGFFRDLANIFSGSYSKKHSIEECWQQVLNSIPDLLEPKLPLILTISGNNEVIWLGMSQDKIQTTTQIVHNDDEIVFGKFKAIVNPPTSDEIREDRIARLRAELEDLETGL